MLSRKSETTLTWHRRLGHVNFNKMRKMRDIGARGLKLYDNDTEIKLTLQVSLLFVINSF